MLMRFLLFGIVGRYTKAFAAHHTHMVLFAMHIGCDGSLT